MADDPAHSVPDARTRQARPPGTTRANRTVGGGALAVLLVGGGLATMLAMQRPQERHPLDEAAAGEVILPEGMREEARGRGASPSAAPRAPAEHRARWVVC